MTIDKRSISDRLAAFGYGHRANDATTNTGKREVYSIATGEIIGRFDAFEAIAFLSVSQAKA